MKLQTSADLERVINHWQAESDRAFSVKMWDMAEASENHIRRLKRDLRMARIEEKLDELLSMTRKTSLTPTDTTAPMR